MNAAYVREHYQVPAKRDGRIRFSGFDEPLTVGDVLCDEYDDGTDEACMEPSRFQVARSDGDQSFGPGEACEAHLAAVVAGMVNGETAVRAVVSIRWDGAEDLGQRLQPQPVAYELPAPKPDEDAQPDWEDVFPYGTANRPSPRLPGHGMVRGNND